MPFLTALLPAPRFLTPVLLALIVLAPLLAAEHTVRLDGPVFRVSGGPARCEDFAVSVDAPGEIPALNGTCAAEAGGLSFRPKYPLQPGLRYRAVYRGAVSVFEIPKPVVAPSTVVDRVYPSSATIPENILKFYLHFSAPMNRGEAYRHLRLLDGSGAPVALPFLEIDQELWDREARRLTVLFDPGRIKRGLVPNEEVGLPIRAGGKYTLVIDAGWQDAAGLPLKQEFRKAFRAVESDRIPPDPKTWTLTAPAAGRREPLALEFPEPMDHALLLGLIEVTSRAGRPIEGSVDVDREEMRWRFTPAEPWKPGEYAIQVGRTIEDRAGNTIGRPFDVDVFERVEERISRETVPVHFTVR